MDEYCPDCGHGDYDRYEDEDGRYVECGSCGFTERLGRGDD